MDEQNTKSFWKFFEKNFLGIALVFSALMISGSLIYTGAGGLSSGNGPAQVNNIAGSGGDVRASVSVDNDPYLGNKNAPVTVIEFSDYQCPFCRSFWRDTLPQIKSEYVDTGKIVFVYRDYPLSSHPMAQKSAEAAECAGDQGKYWQMHDKLFIEQEKGGQGTVQYTIEDLKKWALEVGLNGTTFNQCLDSGAHKEEVQKDFNDGSAVGVTGTPAFFVNGRLVVGAQPFAAFKAVIDEELKK